MRSPVIDATPARWKPGISSSAAVVPRPAKSTRPCGESGVADAIHRPGFLQADGLARWYAHAGAFVHPAMSEPWGLVVNEAAACGLPLVISDRAGAVETFVPEHGEPTGRRFDPTDEDAIAAALAWISGLPADERRGLGARAATIASEWGPERFASGTIEALRIAETFERQRGKRPAPSSLDLSPMPVSQGIHGEARS